MGIVNWVVPDEELDAETHKLAVRLASGPTVAYSNAKNYSIKQIICRWNPQLQMEAERMADSMITSDHAEGITAFMEKRPPKFSGK